MGWPEAWSLPPSDTPHILNEDSPGAMGALEGRAEQSAQGLIPAFSSWQCRIRPSVFKPVTGTGKGFLSMQSLAAHKGQKLWRSNGSLHTLACHPPLSPGPRASQAQARAQLLHALSLDEGGPEPEPSLSDSSSGGSFGHSPSTGPGPFSSSLGHINHLGGSLDRASRGPKEAGPLPMMSCLPEPPPPYEFSCPTAEDMVAVLPGSCEELKRGLSDEDGSNPFTQVRIALPWGPVLSLGIGVQGRQRVTSQHSHVALGTRE